MIKWEYKKLKTYFIYEDGLTEILNIQGQNGWEIIQIIFPFMEDPKIVHLYMKRRIE